MKANAAAPVSPIWKRLLWFGGIWGGSVFALGLIATIIRFVLHP